MTQQIKQKTIPAANSIPSNVTELHQKDSMLPEKVSATSSCRNRKIMKWRNLGSRML